MPFTLPAPSTLEDVFKMNPGAFAQGQEMLQGGMQQGQADLRKTQLQNLFDEQNDPLRVEHQRLANQGLETQIPGWAADAQMKQRKNSNEAALNDDALKAARQKFLTDASDADLKLLENRAQEMAYSFDPKVRAQGEMLLNMSKEMVRERSKQADMGKRRLAEIAEGGRQARLTQADAIAAGKFAKNSKAVLTLEQAIDNAKTARERHQKLIDAATQAEQGGDMDAAERYRARAVAVRPQAEAEIAMPKPGQINAGAVAGMPVNPSPQIAPPSLDQRNSNIPKELPQGTKINPDGTFTLPDGTRIRKKAQ